MLQWSVAVDMENFNCVWNFYLGFTHYYCYYLLLTISKTLQWKQLDNVSPRKFEEIRNQVEAIASVDFKQRVLIKVSNLKCLKLQKK